KDKFLNASNQHLYVELGTRPVSELEEMVESGKYDDLNPELALRLHEIESRFEQEKNPLWIDLLLDKGLYDAMFTLSGKNKSGYIRELVMTQIDLINIKTLIRIKASSYDKEVLKDFIMDNGHLNLAFYEEAYDEALSALPGRLTIYGYEDFLEEAIEDFGYITSLVKYEQLAETFFFEKVKQAKYIAFGVEPLVGYILAIENEAKLIRMIMVGKINNISTDAIKERLGDVYV
ncbi:MAG TPA: V-type ATPase subunit, partial [Fusibacter sp.]|nr:V-type ATPase subunit [Fusibacter sp.]